MELPSVDNQGLIIALLTAISGILVRIAAALLKREREMGAITSSLNSLSEKIDELKKDLDGIALFVGTPRAIATNNLKKEDKTK